MHTCRSEPYFNCLFKSVVVLIGVHVGGSHR